MLLSRTTGVLPIRARLILYWDFYLFLRSGSLDLASYLSTVNCKGASFGSFMVAPVSTFKTHFSMVVLLNSAHGGASSSSLFIRPIASGSTKASIAMLHNLEAFYNTFKIVRRIQVPSLSIWMKCYFIQQSISSRRRCFWTRWVVVL